MRTKYLRASALLLLLCLLGACAPEAKPAFTTAPDDAMALRAIQGGAYIREGLDAAIVDAHWVALEGAAYRGDEWMVPARPLVELLGGKIVGRAGEERVVPLTEAARDAKVGDAPLFLPARDVAEALSLSIVPLEADDGARGLAMLPSGAYDASSSWQREAALSHWALLGARAIEYDDDGDLLHDAGAAAEALALVSLPDARIEPYRIRRLGYFDVQVLGADLQAVGGADADAGSSVSDAPPPSMATPSPNAASALPPAFAIAAQPIEEDRLRIMIVCRENGSRDDWFTAMEADEPALLGQPEATARALSDAAPRIAFEAISVRWGRPVSLYDLLAEAQREDSRVDIVVAGFGEGGAIAQALVSRLWAASSSKHVVGYTFGATRAALTRLDSQDAAMPLFHALRGDDVLANAGGWMRPGREGLFEATPAVATLGTPLECLRAAQLLLASARDDADVSLAWALVGGRYAPDAAWDDASRARLRRWIEDMLPDRLGVSGGAAPNAALVASLTTPSVRDAIVAAHEPAAYADCARDPDGGWIVQRDMPRWSDATAGSLRLFDTPDEVYDAFDLDEDARTAADKKHVAANADATVTFEAIDPEQPDVYFATSIELTSDFLEGPRGLRVGDSKQSVLDAFPGGDRTKNRTSTTILFRDEAKQDVRMAPPYGVFEAAGGAQRLVYAISAEPLPDWVSGVIGMRVDLSEREMRITFELTKDAVSSIRLEIR